MKTLKKSYFILIFLTVFFITASILFLTAVSYCDSIGEKNSNLTLKGVNVEKIENDPDGCEYALNLGSFPANKGKLVSFDIKNVGGNDINVLDLKTFCGCSNVYISSKKIFSKKAVNLKFSIVANSLQGKFSKVMYIKTDAPKNKLLKIRYYGESQTFFNVKPFDTFYASIIKRDVVLTKKFTVTFREKLKNIYIKTATRNQELYTLLKGNLRPFIRGNLKKFGIVSVEDITENSFSIIMSVEPKNAEKGKASLSFVLPIVKPEKQPTLKIRIIGRVY